jgi:hypothetical protein
MCRSGRGIPAESSTLRRTSASPDSSSYDGRAGRGEHPGKNAENSRNLREQPGAGTALRRAHSPWLITFSETIAPPVIQSNKALKYIPGAPRGYGTRQLGPLEIGFRVRL